MRRILGYIDGRPIWSENTPSYSGSEREAGLDVERLAGPWEEKRVPQPNGEWYVHGPCWSCGSAIRYRVDEDGTPRDIEPDAPRVLAALRSAAPTGASLTVFRFDDGQPKP